MERVGEQEEVENKPKVPTKRIWWGFWMWPTGDKFLGVISTSAIHCIWWRLHCDLLLSELLGVSLVSTNSLSLPLYPLSHRQGWQMKCEITIKFGFQISNEKICRSPIFYAYFPPPQPTPESGIIFGDQLALPDPYSNFLFILLMDFALLFILILSLNFWTHAFVIDELAP